jgi:hypothetical protein
MALMAITMESGSTIDSSLEFHNEASYHLMYEGLRSAYEICTLHVVYPSFMLKFVE